MVPGEFYGKVGRTLARAGMVGLVMSYRLAPEVQHPEQVRDVASESRKICKNLTMSSLVLASRRVDICSDGNKSESARASRHFWQEFPHHSHLLLLSLSSLSFLSAVNFRGYVWVAERDKFPYFGCVRSCFAFFFLSSRRETKRPH